VCEPRPHLTLEGNAIDRALAAIGNFADLASPYLVGHSRGVAGLASAAANTWGAEDPDIGAIRRRSCPGRARATRRGRPGRPPGA
jgi:hypothetical protein